MDMLGWRGDVHEKFCRNAGSPLRSSRLLFSPGFFFWGYNLDLHSGQGKVSALRLNEEATACKLKLHYRHTNKYIGIYTYIYIYR